MRFKLMTDEQWEYIEPLLPPHLMEGKPRATTGGPEATYHSLKGKYGEFLHSRKWTMQKREAGLRVIAHNMRQLIRFRIKQKMKLLD